MWLVFIISGAILSAVSGMEVYAFVKGGSANNAGVAVFAMLLAVCEYILGGAILIKDAIKRKQ